MSEKTEKQTADKQAQKNAADKQAEHNEVRNEADLRAEEARKELADKDPFEDRDNIQRAYPSAVDDLGTPDTQPNQPTEALGEGQVSIASIQEENEKSAKESAHKK